MTGATLANSPLLYVLVAAGLLAILLFALYSYTKAKKRCLELGMSKDTISAVVKSTISAALVPSLAILLGFVILAVSLGVAWPWWRLSVIGSLSYEAMAASYTANGIGVQLSEVLSSNGDVFGAIMIVMSLGLVTGPILVTLLAKKYSTGIMKAKGQSEWGQIMSGCFFLAMFAVYIPIMLFTNVPTTLTLLVSFGVTIICGMIGKKHRWFNDFTMAIAMIIAMASSVLWVHLFG